MRITNIPEAKAKLSSIIDRVAGGEEIIIIRAGQPVAKIVRYEKSDKPRTPGALRGKIAIADDFDELPEDLARSFGLTRRASSRSRPD